MIDDTIAAITTALGPAGVGIIRISGLTAEEVADKVFFGKKGIKLREKPNYTMSYGYVKDKEGIVIDEVLALVMRKPHSYTGETVVELQCHGGMVVLKKILELIMQAGARLAEPGEFSKRAFLNGRLDLSQAEAIMDLINAKTEKAVVAAASTIQGSTLQEINVIKSGITEILAYLEADIDFPEEDITRLTKDEIIKRISEVKGKVTSLIATYKSGRIIREGLKTVLIGKPNVGKSSLLNALLNDKRAIVTEVPGTTRDIIEEYYNLGGIPLVLIDTAGMRETEDLVEKIGVKKTREAILQADIIIYVLDILEGITAEDMSYIKDLPRNKVIILGNKVDVANNQNQKEEIETVLKDYRVLYISAKERYGLKELEEMINEIFWGTGLEVNNKTLLTNLRQKDALIKAEEALHGAQDSAEKDMPADFITIDLKQAWYNLGEVTGESLDEDIVDKIFSQFCLGK